MSSYPAATCLGLPPKALPYLRATLDACPVRGELAEEMGAHGKV